MNDTQSPQAGSGKVEVTLLDILKLLLSKSYWLLLAGVLAGACVFLVTTFLITPTYESRVSFYVYNSTNNNVQSGTINNGDLQAAESLATTYSKILASNSILDAVLQELGPDVSLSRKSLSGMVSVSVITDTQLLEVVITSTDPAFACRVAGAFAKSRRPRSSASQRPAASRSLTSRRYRRTRPPRAPSSTPRSA